MKKYKIIVEIETLPTVLEEDREKYHCLREINNVIQNYHNPKNEQVFRVCNSRLVSMRNRKKRVQN